MSTAQTLPTISTELASPVIEETYRKLLDVEETEISPVLDERPVRLCALEDLHFLDCHACLLLARARHTPVLVLRGTVPEHLCARGKANTRGDGDT